MLTALGLCCLVSEAVRAIQPADVAIVCNRNMPASQEVAEFYCEKRGVPRSNIVRLDLPITEDINIADYRQKLVSPLRAALKDRKDRIQVVLCVYGVPLRVGADLPTDGVKTPASQKPLMFLNGRERLQMLEKRLKELEEAAKANPKGPEATEKAKVNQAIASARTTLQSVASVDSELMHLWWDEYDRAGPCLNLLHFQAPPALVKDHPPLIMTARLDGPTAEIAKRLVADAVEIEKVGLKGKVYVDARDQRYDPKTDPNGFGYGGYDESMREMAGLLKDQAKLDVILDNKSSVFAPGACPECALYCGWYSHANYVDSCTFVKGAVAWHLASSEAVSLRRKNSTLWCQRILENGGCATIGPVAEPFTLGFPKPAEFFGFLITGEYTLVECYARTLNVTSWMCTLIGDPLYNPYKASPRMKSTLVSPSPKGRRFLTDSVKK